MTQCNFYDFKWKEEFRLNPRALVKYLRKANIERERRWKAPLFLQGSRYSIENEKKSEVREEEMSKPINDFLHRLPYPVATPFVSPIDDRWSTAPIFNSQGSVSISGQERIIPLPISGWQPVPQQPLPL